MGKIDKELMERVYKGKVTVDDAFFFLDCDPFELFKFADRLRYEAVGDNVTYVVNRNINFTNKCVGNCGFCAFKDNNNSYQLEIKDILAKVKEAYKSNASEVCIQGGLMPDATINWYISILEAVKAEYPQMHIHAFSPMEIYYAAKKSNMSIKEVLHALKNAGLDTIPGTAAEILCDDIRKKICPGKLLTQEWKEVVISAHKIGIPTTATMMYGHIESWKHRIEHMMIIRDIQQQTKGITEFVPLPFMPYNNPIGELMMKQGQFATIGMDDLKIYALSRIIFHTHIKNIQCSWVKIGKKLAQVALNCGANDLGGTIMEENISSSAGANHGTYITVEELNWIIKSSNRIPKQRNTLYDLL